MNEGDIKAKIGPLPAYAWAGLIVGLVLAGRWYMNRRSDATAADTSSSDTTGAADGSDTTDTADTDPTDDSGDTDGLDTAYDDYLQDDPTNPAYPVSADANGTPAPTTNAQWARIAGDYLISKGDNPTTVVTALAYYVEGKALNTRQQAIVNEALTAFGTPPEGVKAIKTTSPTTAVPGTPQVNVKTVGKNAIAIEWSPVTNATSYQVTVDSKVHYTAGKSYTARGLKTKTKHSFSVRARNKKGQLSAANSVTVETK